MFVLEPIKTEKAIGKIEFENTMLFNVTGNADKKGVKQEVERLFGVKVDSVRMLIAPTGKKKAIVKLKKEFKASDVAAKLKMI